MKKRLSKNLVPERTEVILWDDRIEAPCWHVWIGSEETSYGYEHWYKSLKTDRKRVFGNVIRFN